MSRTRNAPEKSPSERLRAVFYRLFLEEKSDKEFEEFYLSRMNMLIEHYKSKLKTQK